MAVHFSTRRWQDQAILVLAVWLIISPMVFGYASSAPVSIDAFFAGVIMAVLAVFDLYQTYLWAVVLNLIVGVWVAVSPWLINTVRDRAMSASLLIVGIATVVLALWELRTDPELHKQWLGNGSAR